VTAGVLLIGLLLAWGLQRAMYVARAEGDWRDGLTGEGIARERRGLNSVVKVRIHPQFFL
jgi:hypothetical protein